MIAKSASALNASISLFAKGLVKHARPCKGMSAFALMNADVNSLKCLGRRMTMGKLDELKTVQDIVKEILEDNESARSDDNFLFYLVYKVIGKKNGIDIDSMSMPRFFLHMKEYRLPSIETIRRTRQKLQAANPELCADDTVQAHRMMNEEAFLDYARGF